MEPCGTDIPKADRLVRIGISGLELSLADNSEAGAPTLKSRYTEKMTPSRGSLYYVPVPTG